MLESNFSENFSIKGDVFFLQKGNELRVREAILFKKSGETYVPEATEVTLLIFPVGEGVGASMEDGFVCLSFFGRAAVSVTLHLAENIFSGFERVYAFFYSGH